MGPFKSLLLTTPMQDGANMAFNVTGINSISPGHWEFQSSWNQFCTSSVEHIVNNNVCTVWFLSLWTQSQSLEIQHKVVIKYAQPIFKFFSANHSINFHQSCISEIQQNDSQCGCKLITFSNFVIMH